MADLTITAANVVKGAGAVTETGTLGASVTAGQALAKDETDQGKIKLLDVDSENAWQKVCCGIALHAGAANQPITFQKAGELTIGATLAPGTIFVGSDAAGGISPSADLGAEERLVLLGYAKTAAIMVVALNNTGVDTPA